jgi:putative tryptophan/tyrosine transport system substrate-binding protein
MRRRDFITLIGGTSVAWPLIARAQQVQKIPTVGVLWHAASAEEEAVYLSALRQGLADLGYVEGKNIILENRFPAETPERFNSLAAELVALKVDIFVAVNRLDVLAAQHANATMPVVFIYVPDPVGDKFVASLAHPGGNITGLSNFAYGLAAKRVEYLKVIVPSLSRVALLVNPNDKENVRRNVEESQAAAEKLKLLLRPMEIRKPDDMPLAFSLMPSDKIDGVIVSQDGLFFANRQAIADLALSHRLPTITYSRETLEAGALASYGPSSIALFRRAGAYIDKILKGEKPADLPVELPTTFEFLLNRKIAETLGLTLPPTVLATADEVIE